MNAAWVGIVGVAVGGVLAGATAVGTSWFQLRLARIQQEAQEKEADRQRRYDSLVERRPPKTKAYQEFMLEAQEISERIGQDIANARRTGIGQEFGMGPMAVNVTRKHTAVAIHGPQDVKDSADAIVEVLVQLAPMTFMPGAGGNEPQVMDLFRRLGVHMALFNAAARRALEDDGRPPEITV